MHPYSYTHNIFQAIVAKQPVKEGIGVMGARRFLLDNSAEKTKGLATVSRPLNRERFLNRRFYKNVLGAEIWKG